MLKKLGLTLFLTSGLLSTTHAVAEISDSHQGISIEFKLPPNEPQTFTNAAFWTITATCKISTRDIADVFNVHVLKKTGKVNGQNLSSGDILNFTVHSGEKMEISAESGAQVEITNQGLHTVVASCTA